MSTVAQRLAVQWRTDSAALLRDAGVRYDSTDFERVFGQELRAALENARRDPATVPVAQNVFDGVLRASAVTSAPPIQGVPPRPEFVGLGRSRKGADIHMQFALADDPPAEVRAR